MRELPKIVHDVAEDNPVLSEDIGRMVGKTIKKVRLGTCESRRALHDSEVLYIEFTSGEILVIDTGSNLIEFDSISKKETKDIHIDFMFTWDPETPGS